MTTSPGKEALLRATIAVVARGGLRDLTYRAVAAEANVSHGLVRHHFGTRDSLLAEALEFAVTESLRQTSMTGTLTDASEFGRGIEALAERDDSLQAFQYELLLASRHRPELKALVQQYYDAYRNATAAHLQRLGVTDRALVDVIWFSLDGLVFKELVHGDRADSERVMARIRQLIVESSKKENPSD